MDYEGLVEKGECIDQELADGGRSWEGKNVAWTASDFTSAQDEQIRREDVRKKYESLEEEGKRIDRELSDAGSSSEVGDVEWTLYAFMYEKQSAGRQESSIGEPMIDNGKMAGAYTSASGKTQKTSLTPSTGVTIRMSG